MTRRTFTVFLLLSVSVAMSAAGRNEYDDDCVDALVLHRTQAIELSRLAVERNVRPELRAFAQALIEQSERDIAELRPLRDNGEPPVRDELGKLPGMRRFDLTGLREKRGEEFERAFIGALSEHLGGGIALARYEIARGADAAVKRKARGMVEQQTAERRALLALR